MMWEQVMMSEMERGKMSAKVLNASHGVWWFICGDHGRAEAHSSRDSHNNREIGGDREHRTAATTLTVGV